MVQKEKSLPQVTNNKIKSVNGLFTQKGHLRYEIHVVFIYDLKWCCPMTF